MSIQSFFKGLLGDVDVAFNNEAKVIVAKINSLEAKYKDLSEADIKKEIADIKERIKNGETEENVLPDVFALVREVGKRTLNNRHYDVQLIGGYALWKGMIAEMRTGEGKTLVATLPASLKALSGNGVHIITVNDYLARRDAVWMGQIYDALGLSVGVINTQGVSYIYDGSYATKEDDKARDEQGSYRIDYEFLRPASRREAYACDITYGTNNEFGFDYLRDNLATTKEYIVQRGYNFALIDEVDSILIDEARTPLIISSATKENIALYPVFSSIATSLVAEEDYLVDEKLKAISLTESGIEKAEKALGIDSLYTDKGIKYVHHLETAVRAKALFTKDKEYVVSDGKIIIVDQSTGRMMPGRRFSYGLHQALEAKEGVKILEETRTVASITFQNYFRLYKSIAGMTGTASTSKEEFYSVYGLDVVAIPTHRAVSRIDNNDLIFQTEAGKFKAIARRVKELYEKRQPVLIGTISIEKNELLSAYLTKEGVPHKVLNAKNHESEGEIIAQAGRKGSVVIATNMAGRGVDIKLGGDPVNEQDRDEIRNLGGLFVLGTERHESRRIDNQLRGRAGRQGDPGETQFYVSMEDDLMRIFGGDKMKSLMGKLGIKEDEPIKASFVSRSLETAQKKIEGFHFDSRKSTLEYDNVLTTQRQAIYKLRNEILNSDKAQVIETVEEIAGSEISKSVKGAIEQSPEFEEKARRVLLVLLDAFWVEHLEAMDYIKSSVSLRSYGQREPIVEYKKEGLVQFQNMMDNYKKEVKARLEGLFAESEVQK